VVLQLPLRRDDFCDPASDCVSVPSESPLRERAVRPREETPGEEEECFSKVEDLVARGVDVLKCWRRSISSSFLAIVSLRSAT
jgi:hypothetical protein